MKQHTVMTPYLVGEVHYYSTEIDGELVLFDTGPPTAEGSAHLKSCVDLQRLKYLFITHCHVDHYGLAAYVEANSKARIFFPRKDVLRLRRLDEWRAGLQALLTEAGFPADLGERLQGSLKSHQSMPPCPREYAVVEDSELPARLGITVLPCPGHSQSDLVYLHDGYAVTGDVLLRDIFQSPLLDLDVETFSGRFRNYDAYCGSLTNIARLRGYVILPSHRQYVEGVDQTVLFYLKKLLERAGQVKRYAHLEKVSDVVRQIFGPDLMNPFVVYLKASEIFFMRDFLAEPEKLKDALQRIVLFDQVQALWESVLD